MPRPAPLPARARSGVARRRRRARRRRCRTAAARRAVPARRPRPAAPSRWPRPRPAPTETLLPGDRQTALRRRRGGRRASRATSPGAGRRRGAACRRPQPVDGTDLTEVSLNLRTDAGHRRAARRPSARRCVAAGFVEDAPPAAEPGLAAQSTFSRGDGSELLVVGILDRDGERTLTLGGRVRAACAVGCPREPHDPALVDVEDVRSRIDARADQRTSRQLRTVLAAASGDADVLADAVAQMLTGGKRLRAAFCYWSWRAHGGRAGHGRRPTRCCGWAPRSSCSRRPRCSTTTSWTTPTPAAGSPPRTARSPACTPQHGLTGDADRFGDVGRDPARRPHARRERAGVRRARSRCSRCRGPSAPGPCST